MREKYQLRQAAGCYWLLNMEQSGKDYIQPVVLNESGAEIWKRLQAGNTIAQIAEEFNRQFQIPLPEAVEDIRQFVCQLREQGMKEWME